MRKDNRNHREKSSGIYWAAFNMPGFTAAGFTLIELLVASAIAAILMVCVLTIVSQLSRDQSRLAKRQTQFNPSASPLVELLQKDLARATSVTTDTESGSIILDGYGAMSPAGQIPSGRAVRVIYRISGKNAGSWLVREQRALDEAASKPWIECVCPDIKSMTLSPQYPANAVNGGVMQAKQPEAPRQPPSLADRFQLRVKWTDATRNSAEQMIVLR